MKVIVTGSSGLLGRAVYNEFKLSNHEVIGTAFTRGSGELITLDLKDLPAVIAFIEEQKPHVIVHCAAERRPDVAEKDREGARILNTAVPSRLAALCKLHSIFLIHISTDYVFDGGSPPYEPGDAPNPLNFYGESKLAGEEAVAMEFEEKEPGWVILRVPVLYGHAEFNAESAINVLLDAVKNTSKQTDMDDYQLRYPTNVDDVARVIKDISVGAVEQNKPLQGIYHFSAEEKYTKYEIAVLFAELLGVENTHLIRISTIPASATATRPYDCHLSNRKLKEAGIDTSAVGFEGWWRRELSRRK